MRRSHAPSMRLAAKLKSENPQPPEEQAEEPPCSWPSNSPQMEWGSSKTNKNLVMRELKPGENPLRESRIFHVLWRNQTTKKHKTWTGNGTLVVTGSKMTLKDHTGLVVGTATSFKPRQFNENDQLQIGSRDVEVQEEFKTVEECAAYRKLEIANWCRKIDTQNGLVDDPLPVVNLPFRPHGLKKRLRRGSPTEVQEHGECPTESRLKIASWSQEINSTSLPPERRIRLESRTEAEQQPPQVEYLCLLAPAELQKKTLHFLSEHGRNEEQSVLIDMVQEVCDHPVLLKTRVNQPESLELMQLLQPCLPPWKEMGLYDSAKFEFVHLMLDDLVVERGQKCCIVANSQECLRLIKGYCQHENIAHVQLAEEDQVAAFNAVGNAGSPSVALALTSQLPEIQSLRCKYLIIYNHNARQAASHLLAEMDKKIYTLITSGGCPEEQEFYRNLTGLATTADDVMESLQSYRDVSQRQTVKAPEESLTDWTMMEPPYTEEFLQDACISENLERLKRIYFKSNKVDN